MTKEEFIQIVNRFNDDKVNYNWLEVLNWTKNYRFINFKKLIKNFPDYYEFIDANEFKYWLKNSEQDWFIDERFCKICGSFIEKNSAYKQFVPYAIGCCREHQNIIRFQIIHESNIKKYGVESPMKLDSVKEKAKKTNLVKYGVEYPLQNKDIHAKTIETGNKNGSYIIGAIKVKQTKLKKYGDENYNNKESASKKKLNWTEERRKLYISRCKATKLERYGNENYRNSEKAKQTCLKLYGVENPAQCPEIMARATENSILSKIKNHTTQAELMKNKEFKDSYIKKVRRTKKENNTTNTSINFEDKLISYLKEKYPQYTIIQSYSDDKRYPFECDCYIKELDLFIEFQGSYYHNYRPFNGSKEHIDEYNQLIKKGPQLRSIAEVWRYKDPEKREYAEKNKLNYLEYWEYLKILPEDINNNKNNLVLYYQQYHFYEKNRKELFDPIKRWEYYKNAVEYSDFYKNRGYISHLTLLRRPYISKQIGYSSFNIKLCDIIDKKYKVYDPCGGWGHRLLGFRDHKLYIYNDINTRVKTNCIKMSLKEGITNCKFYNQDAALPINDDYDIVFTCPPYFNKEIFTNKGAENYTEEEFVVWWNKVLDNLHPKTGEIYIVINSNYLKYFTSNDYQYEIVNEKLRKSHYHKNTKESSEIIVKFTKF